MRIQAIILKKIPIRDYDELIVCYTQNNGKQAYQAKSVLRPTSKQASHLDILNLVDFSLAHKNSYPIITSAYCLNSFCHLKESLPAMAVVYFLLECFDKLIFENEPDLKLWNFLLMQLQTYNSQLQITDTNWPGLIAHTRQKFLQVLGYDPNIPIEQLANSQFRSLQFAREVLE